MQQRRRRWWTRVIAAVAFIVVAAASLSAVFTLVLDISPTATQALQARVTKTLGAPAHIATMSLSWRNLQPELALHDITILGHDGQPALHIDDLRIGADYLALLHGTLRPARIQLAGLAVTLDVDANGRWTLRGFNAGREMRVADVTRLLRGLKQLRVRRCTVTIDDARLGSVPLTFNADGDATRTGDEPDFAYAVQLAATPPPAVAGRLELHAELHGAVFDGSDWDGQWRASLQDLRSAPWLNHWLGDGRQVMFDNGSVQLQGRAIHGQASTATLQFSAAGVAAVTRGHPLAAARNITADMAWQATANGWQLAIERLSASDSAGSYNLAPADLRIQHAGATVNVSANAAEVPLGAAAPWLALWPRAAGLLAAWPGLRGSLDAVTFKMQSTGSAEALAPAWTFDAGLKNIGWQAHADVPGANGVSGQLEARNDGGQFTPNGAFSVSLPQHFATPVEFDQVRGTVSWRPADGGGWQIDAPTLQVETAGATARGEVHVSLPPTGTTAVPKIALKLQLAAADAARLKAFMPKTWSPLLRNWLTQALVKVPVTQGQLVIDGALHAFPYDRPATQKLGHWSLDLQTADATLRFDPHWPAARKLSAALHLAGDSLSVKVSDARIDDVQVTHATADMQHLDDHELAVEATANADLKAWYALLLTSPLREQLHGLLEDSTVSGPAQVDLQMAIPLHAIHDSVVHGTAQLNGATYQSADFAIPATGIGGSLSFDHHGLTGLQLTGNYDGTPVSAALQSAGNEPAIEISFAADPARDAVAAHYLPAWLRARLRGASAWQLTVPVSRAHDWTLVSDLHGTAIDLPPPLGKNAETASPVTITATTNAANARELRIDGGARFGVRLRYAGTPAALRGAGLRIGPGSPVDDSEDGLRVVGTFEDLQLGKTLRLLTDLPHTGIAQATDDAAPVTTLPLLGARLTARSVTWGEARVKEVHVQIAPRGAGLDIAITGDNADGSILWDPALRRVQARFAKLHLEQFGPSPTLSGKPTTPATHAVLNPSTLPTLDAECRALSVADYALGTLRLVTAHTDGGQKLTTATLSGPSAGVSLQGDWTRINDASSARVGFAVNMKKLGDALQAFGFARTVTAHAAHFSGSVQFPPAATGLDFTQLKGTVDLKLDDGELTAVRPGMGRVFGLLNVYALPRRLLRGFKDVADKGLTYDHVTAHFTLGDGQAYTKNARIVGPSLSLDVHGRIGLRDHDLDETVHVYTNIASSITLGATLVGGPIAGGIALLAQELVGKAINQLTELRYRVTGSWNNPQVARLDDDMQSDSAPVPPAAAVSTAGTAPVTATRASPAIPAPPAAIRKGP